MRDFRLLLSKDKAYRAVAVGNTTDDFYWEVRRTMSDNFITIRQWAYGEDMKSPFIDMDDLEEAMRLLKMHDMDYQKEWERSRLEYEQRKHAT